VGNRPQYQPTPEARRQVMTMTGFGIVQDDIARWLDIDKKTLRKHFRREIDTGAIEANTRVAASLYGMATKDKNVAAAIFWLKSRAGWKDQDPSLGANNFPRLLVMFGQGHNVQPQVTFEAEPNDC
jgi:hypothetical protein